MSAKIIPSSTLSEMLSARGFNPTDPRDENVFLPSMAWIKEFSAFLNTARFNLPAYHTERWDCDDFAFWAVTQASLANSQTNNESGHSFLYATLNLIGTLNNVPGPACHATNLVLLDDMSFLCFEPQNGLYCPWDDSVASGLLAIV